MRLLAALACAVAIALPVFAEPAELRVIQTPHKFGIRIPGNAAIMVFRNDYAVRMLEASVAAGIEAPLRFYVTENADGSASLTYREPSAVFAPYGVPQLDALASELDTIFGKIAAQAIAP